VTLENLSDKAMAERLNYPDKSFAYSQIGPAVLRFPKPVQLYSVFLKQHRAPNFYLKKSKSHLK
jgi:hypothetical protein